MKVKLTGGTGFVGQNLIKYLDSNDFELQNISRTDLLNISELNLNECSALVHLAGKAHDLKNTANIEAYHEVNYELTKQLYDAFLKSDSQKFIFISSVKAAADSVENILTEEAVPNPKTAYGKSKLLAEKYIQEQPLPLGKSYYILRPCMIHGPGNKGNLNLLYKFVQKSIPYPLAAFKNKRSFLSVSNLCFVIKELLGRNIESGIYNVADDEALSTNKIVKLLSISSSKRVKLFKCPIPVINLLAKLGDLFHLPINTEKLKKLTGNYVVSNAKLKKVLSLEEMPTSAEDGLIATVQSFK